MNKSFRVEEIARVLRDTRVSGFVCALEAARNPDGSEREDLYPYLVAYLEGFGDALGVVAEALSIPESTPEEYMMAFEGFMDTVTIGPGELAVV